VSTEPSGPRYARWSDRPWRDRARWREWASGPRPAWWPENEPWPPRRRHWGHGPPRFIARFVVALIVGLVLINVVILLVASLVAQAFGLLGFGADVFRVLVIALVIFVLVTAVMGSGLRRASLPIARAIEVIGKVAEGDYTARVAEGGPREMRRLIAAFNDMVERLETSDQRRRRLLADVTHELRTPLSVIQGQIEGAVDGVYPRDDEHLGAILDETRHMARIIEDLRTLSLAESGALELRREPIDVAEVVEDVADAYRPSAEGSGVTIASQVKDGLPQVDADATRVRQILENLVSNALRYTPAGGRIDVAASLDGPEAVAVAVRDTGRGIAPADLPFVFDRFTRSADSRGTGLGLAIARDLVRAHGGEIAATSEGEGRGTTVRFTLPVAR
jgi:signal transduction histidine kinase